MSLLFGSTTNGATSLRTAFTSQENFWEGLFLSTARTANFPSFTKPTAKAVTRGSSKAVKPAGAREVTVKQSFQSGAAAIPDVPIEASEIGAGDES